MPKVNGKKKGNTFERKIANTLSARFADVMGIAASFKRNIDSGSFFGGTNQRRLATHLTEHATFGDLVCPDAFVYSVECKHYKTQPLFSNILMQDCKQWDGWIEQAVQDSKNSNKKMVIIIKYNNVEEFVIVAEPVPGTPTIQYKDYYIVRLSSFLSLPDSYFFNTVQLAGT